MIIIIELICLFFASFFAGMETGLLSADKLKIYSKKQDGSYWARSADFLIGKPERLLGTTLIGTNISVVTSAVILNNFLRTEYSSTVALAGSFVLTIVYLLFAEIIPKTFFRRYADSITVRLALILRVFYYLFLPLSFLLNSFVGFVMFLTGQKSSGDKLPRSRDDFRQLMHLSSREAGFGYDDYRTIDDILDFGETLASEAMIPLHKYPVFHISAKPEEVTRIAGKINQRYFPCYSGRTDNIVGYIDIQDFCLPGKESSEEILRAPVFFPEVKPLPDLLDAMVDDDLEVVFLTDEYGGISGMVSHQEIAAEIIGAIPGNIHTMKQDIVNLGNQVYISSGDADLEYFSHVTDVDLKKQSNKTIGGYLCEKIGVIPKVGMVYQEGRVKYTVLDGDSRAISRIRVEVEQDENED